MSERSLSILLCDPDPEAALPLKTLLEQRNHRVRVCRDGIDAVRQAHAGKPDLILLDVALPRLSGYQCARLLKDDPLLGLRTVVHLGDFHNPIERYWSRICRADACLQKPVAGDALDRILAGIPAAVQGRQPLCPPAVRVTDLEDHAILTMANNSIEHDFLKSSILNDLNFIDITTISAPELVRSLITLFDHLCDFTCAVVLLPYEGKADIFFCPRSPEDQRPLLEIQQKVLQQLRREHDLECSPVGAEPVVLPSLPARANLGATENLFIHVRKTPPVYSVIAFENIFFDDLTESDRDILQAALETSHGLLEKKLFFQKSQELSIIDTVTTGYSPAFFMEVLKREIENAKRNRYPLTLFTLVWSDDVSSAVFGIRPQPERIHAIHHAILNVTRKSDIVARWEATSFVFLLAHTDLDRARIAQSRILLRILEDLTEGAGPSGDPEVRTGICQFDPVQDESAEMFFERVRSCTTNFTSNGV